MPPHKNLPLLMLRARESVTGYFRPVFREYQLTEQQWRVLRQLSEDDSLNLGQLAEACAILQPSLTGILQRMVETGLLQKGRRDGDQRRGFVCLTNKGHALLAEMFPHIHAQYDALEEILGAELLDELYVVSHRVIEKLDEASTPAAIAVRT